MIPPDGRATRAPGIGRNAKRHDLERPATPGLHGSDLQQGDVSRLEQSQRVAPIKKRQSPARTQAPRRSPQGKRQVGEMTVPDPVRFVSDRLGGTLDAGVRREASRQVDPRPWVPLLRRLAMNPLAGGALSTAYITQLSNIVRQPQQSRATLLDLQDLDDSLSLSLGMTAEMPE